MRDFTEDLTDLRRRVDEARRYMHVDNARVQIAELEVEASKPDLWDDPGTARAVTSRLSSLNDDVVLIDGLERRISDLETLHELAREESDESIVPEIESGIEPLRAELDG